MRRIGMLVLFLVALPAVTLAQRPSGNRFITTAEIKMKSASETQVPDDVARFLGEALEAAQSAIETYGDNSKSWFTLGRVHVHLGNTLAADSALDRAEQLWPKYAEDTDSLRFRAFAKSSNAGVAALQANKVEEAIKHLEAATVIYNKRPTAFLNLSGAYARNNQNDKAAAAYKAALDILRGPARAGLNEAEEKQWAEWEEGAALNLAQLYAMTDRNEEAAVAYEEYLKRNPNNSLVQTNLAVVYNRMGKTQDAARIYSALLAQDLPADEYFRVGVGLRRGQQFDQSALALEKAIAKNPQMYEAYFNHAYTVWEMLQPLDEARDAAKTPAEKKRIADQMRPLYEKLLVSAEKARSFDPAGRNMLALMNRAYAGLANTAADKKTSDDYKLKIPPLLAAYDALKFEAANVAMNVEDKKVTVTGDLVNIKQPKGEPMKIRISLLDANGATIGTPQEVSVPAPEVEAVADFKAEFTVDTVPAGWKYEVL